ncbi:2-oxoacid ferredoxin oxidoreductase [Candidatus Roizmanbacteria bacterium]|nr:2-oxoacid ferredoxin oxidoreductase [Candidatus Roizmanbacteria bacterium]
MSTLQDFSGHTPTWCPGCGDWGINMALKGALVKLGLSPSDINVTFDIGCSGNMNDMLNAYAVHGLHGRSVATAIGIKIGNHKMPAIVIGGDGGIYGEGGNHLLHACRGNHDITVIVHDNGVYGLTTGQVAPTGDKGYKSKSTPEGVIESPVNQLALSLTQGASFVAQAFAGDLNHLTAMIVEAISHKGFSLLNVLQPCVTFNKVNTYQYYMPRVYKLGEEYDRTNYKVALEKAHESNEEKFPLGVLYAAEREAYHERALGTELEYPLHSRPRFTDFGVLINEFS